MLVSLSAIAFSILTGLVIIFQGCLAAGLPWGAASMGGRFPGKYPPKMRVVAVLIMLVMGFLAALVLADAKLLFPELEPLAKTGIWFVVVFFLLGTIMNSISPSKIERIWVPVALLQFIASLIVAIS